MNQITILDQANQPMGPFTRAQVTEKLHRGEITLGSLAFVEGLTQWTPVRDVLAHVDATQPPASGALPVPSTPGAPASSAAYSYAATMQPPSHLVYAGFWLRLVALLIDGVVLTVANTIILIPWAIIFSALVGTQNIGFHPPSSGDQPSASTILIMAVMELLLIAAVTVMQWFYFAYFESSSWQATLGKRVLSLRVTNMAGERITFWHATGRYFGKILSGLILYIGFIMAAFTDRKQALHDMIAGTLVVRD